jgi:hypothetical protein
LVDDDGQRKESCLEGTWHELLPWRWRFWVSTLPLGVIWFMGRHLRGYRSFRSYGSLYGSHSGSYFRLLILWLCHSWLALSSAIVDERT